MARRYINDGLVETIRLLGWSCRAVPRQSRLFSATHGVIWTDKTLMVPRHLKQQEAFRETARETRLLLHASHGWGEGRAGLDTPAWSGERVRIRVLDLRLLLSTSVSFDANAAGVQTVMQRLAPTDGQAFAPVGKTSAIFERLARLREEPATDRPLSVHQRCIAQRWRVAEQTDTQTPAVDPAPAVPRDLPLVQKGALEHDVQRRLSLVEAYIAPRSCISPSPHLIAAFARRLVQWMKRQQHPAQLWTHSRRSEYALHIGDILHLTHFAVVRGVLAWLDALSFAQRPSRPT